MEPERMDDDQDTKESSSIYERLYPMRFPMMAIGAIVALVGLGMFIGGFAGLVADMDVKIRRTGAPNVGYMLMLVVSIAVMVGGGVSLFCGCGAIRYRKRQEDIKNGRIDKYKKKKVTPPGKVQYATSAGSRSSTLAFTSAQTRTFEPNGDVTYTVSYQYRGPPPGEINGIPAYPAPPPDVSPTLKIDPNGHRLPPHGQYKMKGKPIHQQRPVAQRAVHQQPQEQIQTPPYMDNREKALALANVPRKLVLVKRI